MGVWNSLRGIVEKRQSVRDGVRGASRQPRRRPRCRDLRVEQFEERVLLSIGTWTSEGPAPIIGGQVLTGSSASSNTVSGAVTAIAVSPNGKTVPGDTVYVGTANGGIWETQNALLSNGNVNPNPTWVPKTEEQSSLSISSLSFDPSSGGQTLVAGIGRMSNDFRQGGSLDGILRSVNGGATWEQLNGNGSLNGRNIVAVAERGNIILVAVDDVNDSTAGTYKEVGIYRSTDSGATFTQISNGNGGTTGLPLGITYDLAGDPTNPNVFYTTVIGADKSAPAARTVFTVRPTTAPTGSRSPAPPWTSTSLRRLPTTCS